MAGCGCGACKSCRQVCLLGHQWSSHPCSGAHLVLAAPQINLRTGGHIASDLCGNRCEHGGKQRIHTVYEDDGWIW